jgi:hypothetical protein
MMYRRLAAVTLSLALAAPTVTAILAGILTVTTPFSAVPIAGGQQARTCGEIVEAFNQRTNAFVAKADQQNIDFIHNEVFKDYTQHYDELKARRDQLNQYRDQLETVHVCLIGGGTCTKTLREQVTGQLREWFDGLVEGAGLSAVRDRVAEAKNLIDEYYRETAAISTDTMTAMQQCTSPMPGQPRVDAGAVPPVAAVDENGLPEVEAPTPVPVDTGGGGTGKLLGGLALVGAAGYGAQAMGLLGQKCTAEAPNNYHSTCENQGRTSASCTALQNEYRTWCDCLGRNFSYSGGCTGNK